MSTPILIEAAPSTVVAPRQAADMLEKSLKSLRLAVQAENIYGKFPTLWEATVRLTWLMPPILKYTFTRRPILDHCLESAVSSASHLDASGKSGVRHAYLNALLDKASMALEINVHDEDARWDILTDKPLGEWLEEHKYAIFGQNPSRGGGRMVSPSHARIAIAMRIVDPHDLAMLTERRVADRRNTERVA